MNLNELRKLAGLPLNESAPVEFKPGYAMSDVDKKLADIGRILMDMAAKEKDDTLSNAMSELGGSLADGSVSSQEDLVSFIKGTDADAATLSDRTTKAIAAYNSGERAVGAKPGEEPEGDFDEPEDEEMMDSVDLSDLRGEYGVNEAGGEDILTKIDSLAAEYGVYGDCDMDTVNKGAEEVASCYSSQDGGESPDDFYMAVKDLLADHGISEAADTFPRDVADVAHKAMEMAGDNRDPDDFIEDAADYYGIAIDDDMYDQVRTAIRMIEAGDDVTFDIDANEAVQETAQNAMDAAMAELRKLAGL